MTARRNVRRWSIAQPALVQLGRPQQAVDCLARGLELKQDASGWTEMGLARELLEDATGAQEAYFKALELDSKYANAYYSLACCLAGQGRLKEALANFRLALTFAPQETGYRVGLGMALANDGQLEAAARAFGECLELEPGNARAWYHQGVTMTRLGKPGPAEACLLQAVELAPRDAEAWLALARVLLQQKKAREGVQCLQQADALGHPAARQLLEMLMK